MSNKNKQPITIFIDKLMLFKLLDSVRDRFWGLMAINILLTMSVICFFINPDLMRWSTPLSDFGGDVRTSPYFALGMFGAAFSLWRWRKYIVSTTSSKNSVYSLLTITILGLYLTALFPVTLGGYFTMVHNFGVILVGASVLLLIIFDQYKSFYKRNHNHGILRLIRVISMLIVTAGSAITILSNQNIAVINIALLGEVLMIGGFAIWVYLKTYLGDNKHQPITKIAKKSIKIKH